VAIQRFARRDFRLDGRTSYVSFTFDDFPRTALTTGGRILADHGVRGTYFVSFGLLGSSSASGPIASIADVESLLQDGHEVGCHTFDHLDGMNVTPEEFERSIQANHAALVDSRLATRFGVFAYPLEGPALPVKRVTGPLFAASRWGGQTFNHDVIDLNLLKAYFLDQRSAAGLDDVARLIESNANAGGWLIFATHDVDRAPSDYGCDRSYFSKLVHLAVVSGARVLPMTTVCNELRISTASAKPTVEH
jgi:peptidoglycan/xylan/chitin deacetylase (PgdA/CDA1 family)